MAGILTGILEEGPLRRFLKERSFLKTQVAEPSEVIGVLEDAEREVYLALDWARRYGPYPKIHEHIQAAHEHLRTASRLLGYRPGAGE